MIPPHPAAAAMRSSEARKGKRNQKKIKSKKHRRTKSPTPETSQLRVVNQEDQFKWELSENMAKYASNHLNIFIQEKDLKESVLKTIPVPSNLQEVRRMDEFMAHLLKEKLQKILLHQDAVFEEMQRKNIDIMGPLCRPWESLETANKEQDSLFLSMI